MAADHARSEALKREDFINELYVLVQEQGYIWEALGPVLDDTRGQEQVRHSPWKQTDCARVLRTWHEFGLLGLYQDGPSGTTVDLEAGAATEVLSMGETWTPETAHLLLCPTKAGNERQFDAWRAALMTPEGC